MAYAVRIYRRLPSSGINYGTDPHTSQRMMDSHWGSCMAPVANNGQAINGFPWNRHFQPRSNIVPGFTWRLPETKKWTVIWESDSGGCKHGFLTFVLVSNITWYDIYFYGGKKRDIEKMKHLLIRSWRGNVFAWHLLSRSTSKEILAREMQLMKFEIGDKVCVSYSKYTVRTKIF